MTSTPRRPVDNVVITTKDQKDRNVNILDGTTVENKGKLILALFIFKTDQNLVYRFKYSSKTPNLIISCSKSRNLRKSTSLFSDAPVAFSSQLTTYLLRTCLD